MARQSVKFIFLQLLIVCSSVKDLKLTESRQIVSHSSRRELSIRTIQHDFFDPSINTFPTTPTTNIPVTTPVFNPVTTPATTNPVITNPSPITVPPDTSTPTVVTVPSANPITPSLPITNPPPTSPVMPPVIVTNPVTSPVPVTNPVTTPSTGIPVVGPPATTNPPAGAGQSWCVVKGGATEATIQAALDYACGIGSSDCASIQQGANCYSPVTLENHASYAFNSYYQKNPQPTSCDFGGAAVLTNVNPSSGSCIYATSSTSGSPTTASPITTNPPNTASSSGSTPTGGSSGNLPSVLNATYPGFGGITNPTGSGTMPGFADGPQSPTGSSISISTGLQPLIGFIVMVVSIVTGRIVLEI